MQQVRSNRDSAQEISTRDSGVSAALTVNRSDLSSLANDYGGSQRQCTKTLFLPIDCFSLRSLDQDRLESLEREMASLKGQVTQSFVPPITEHELSRTFSSKKISNPQPSSARILSPSRLPLAHNSRKLANDELPVVSTNDGPFSRALPQVAVVRSKSFHNSTSHLPSSPPSNGSEEASFLRSYKAHIEQVLRREAPAFSDMKTPSYVSIDDVMKANEQLLLENDRLRSELTRLKTESILLLRSMRAATGSESNLGNERVRAAKEKHSNFLFSSTSDHRRT